MKTYCEFINENIPKNKWVEVQPVEYNNELISLVHNAYKNTSQGPFINMLKDTIKSDWLSIDFDEYPDLDATIFYRKSRSNETWDGKKIQGIGYKRNLNSIHIVINKLKKLLNEKGTWIEASDDLEKVLYKINTPYVKDENLIKKIFPNTELKFIDDKGRYTRLAKNKKIKETIFGYPIFKR